MDKHVLEAMRGGCVYLSAVGGAGLIYDKKMRVQNVFKKEFGMAEAIWQLAVDRLPLIVTMDSYGNSLHEKILNTSLENIKNLALEGCEENKN